MNNENNMFGMDGFKMQKASLTMQGQLAVRSTNGTFCTVDENERLIEIPESAIVLKDADVLMPKFVTELSEGDYIFQDNDFFKVLKDGMAINFSNGMICRLAGKQNLFLGKMIAYRPLFTDFNTIQPQMLAMLGGNGIDAMKTAMMIQMASGDNTVENGDMNPMILSMCMGDNDNMDDSGFKMMMIMQMMKQTRKPENTTAPKTETKAKKTSKK